MIVEMMIPRKYGRRNDILLRKRRRRLPIMAIVLVKTIPIIRRIGRNQAAILTKRRRMNQPSSRTISRSNLVTQTTMRRKLTRIKMIIRRRLQTIKIRRIVTNVTTRRREGRVDGSVIRNGVCVKTYMDLIGKG